MIDIDTLRTIIRHDPKTGKLYWKERPAHMYRTARAAKLMNARDAGREAFTTKDKFGYRQGRIFYKMYKAHRVIWALHHGRWPDKHIDHINGNPSDNRIVNLREASISENMKNRKPNKGSSSKYMGVGMHHIRKKWRAYIWIDGKAKHLGLYENEEDAARAYDSAAREYHGEFARPNFRE